MKKIVWTVVAILVVVVLVVGINYHQKNNLSVNKTIKIGAILPLTGTQAHVGEGLKNALLLAQKNYKGALNFELVIEDTAFDPKIAANAASKLVNIDKVDALLDAYAPIGNAVAPIAEAAKVPHFSIAFDPNLAKGDYNFIHFTPPSAGVSIFIKELERRGIHKVGVLRVNNQGIQAVNDELKKQIASSSVKIVADQVFQPGERDFKSYIANLKKAEPELYVILAIPPELEIGTQQMKEQGIKDISTIIYFELAQNKEKYNGLWFVGTLLAEEGFTKDYETTYNRPISFAAPNVYDIFNLIALAAENSETKDREGIKNELLKIKNFEGVLGILNIDPSGIVISGAELKIMKDGKVETLKN